MAITGKNPTRIKNKNVEITLQKDDKGNPGYVRFGLIDEVTGEETAYLGALDNKNKKELTVIRDFISGLLAVTNQKESV